jgi:hypothetical protein
VRPPSVREMHPWERAGSAQVTDLGCRLDGRRASARRPQACTRDVAEGLGGGGRCGRGSGEPRKPCSPRRARWRRNRPRADRGERGVRVRLGAGGEAEGSHEHLHAEEARAAHGAARKRGAVLPPAGGGHLHEPAAAGRSGGGAQESQGVHDDGPRHASVAGRASFGGADCVRQRQLRHRTPPPTSLQHTLQITHTRPSISPHRLASEGIYPAHGS